MYIKLKEGIDKKFFNLLYNLYKPLLSKGHLKDTYQYTIVNFDTNEPIGILQVNNRGNHFIQIAFIPSMRNKKLGKKVIKKFLAKKSFNRLDWSANRMNYPSLKLLLDLGGGLFKRSLSNKTYEGFYRINPPANKKMIDALKSVLPESKQLFKNWVRGHYNNRKKELKALNNYLYKFKPNHVECNVFGVCK